MMVTKKKSGFTLVELAIVLVIIGLIIGGVLVGQDLIKAATIRAAITDLEKYNAAATTFRGKYNGLPGDLAAAKAIEFGLSTAGDASATGAAGLRDGNGVIQDEAGTSLNLGGEMALLWRDLGQSGLVGGSYPGLTGAVATNAPSATLGTINTFIPRSKLRDSASYLVYSLAGRNYFYLSSITTNGTAVIAPGNAVTPLEGKGIDEKLDDGAPGTGIVLAHTALATADAGTGAPATTTCLSSTTPATASYNVSSAATGASANVVCQLQIRTSF